jgi:hypothetical protein
MEYSVHVSQTKSKIDRAAPVVYGVTDSKLLHMRHVRDTQSHGQTPILVFKNALGHFLSHIA